MRRVGFAGIILLTCYMAGTFRFRPLMVLAGMEGIVFCLSYFLCRYLKQGLSVQVLRHGEITEKGRWLPCRMKVQNTGRLPVSRFCIKLRYWYGQEDRKQKNYQTKWIWGSAGQGETILQLELAGGFCGLVTVQVVCLRVYDYLALFSSVEKLNETVEVAVYPRDRVLSLGLPFLGKDGEAAAPEQRMPKMGETGHEVRQLREYRPGDSSRSIHWNQSARTGQLWVKEYEKEADTVTELFLEREGLGEGGIAGQDAFYELLWALLRGLTKKAPAVWVSWYDRTRGCLGEKEVKDAAQCRELLLGLYREENAFGAMAQEEENNAAWENRKLVYARRQVLRLDGRLRLYWGDRLLFAFSQENLEQQIEGGISFFGDPK